jgi:hypothetical protein
LVPVTNGAIPVAPKGGQSSQAGTLFEFAAGPAVDDPLEPRVADEAAVAVLGPAPDPAEEPLAEEGLAPVLLDAAAATNGAVIPGNVTAPYGFARVMPAVLLVVAVVWADAEPASTIKNSNDM